MLVRIKKVKEEDKEKLVKVLKKYIENITIKDLKYLPETFEVGDDEIKELKKELNKLNIKYEEINIYEYEEVLGNFVLTMIKYDKIYNPLRIGLKILEKLGYEGEIHRNTYPNGSISYNMVLFKDGKYISNIKLDIDDLLYDMEIEEVE